MAQNCAFFNAELSSGEYDRVYLAETFASYFASFIGNGVYHRSVNELKVSEQDTPNMSIKVQPGQGYINGYWYENTSDYTLSVDVADGVLNRIDSIVLRWDRTARDIHLAILKGTAASIPVAPTIQRDADCYDLVLANINISAGAISVTQSAIQDVRSDSNLCGWVTGIIDQIDLTDLFDQWTAFFEEFKQQYTDEFTDWADQAKVAFESWVDTIHDILDESTAGHLQNEIEALQGEVSSLPSITDIIGAIYPVGSLYLSTSNINPSVYLGIGTWEQWGLGKVPVGVDSDQLEFNESEKIGGVKNNSYTPSGTVSGHILTTAEMPSHYHSSPIHSHGMASHSHTIPALSGTASAGGSHRHIISHFTEKVFGSTSSMKRLVGYDSSGNPVGSYTDSFTSTVGNHTHPVTTVPTSTGNASGNTADSPAANTGSAGSGNSHNHGFSGNSMNVSTLQPYITCYMWKRTA